jgi:hypothetical protein
VISRCIRQWTEQGTPQALANKGIGPRAQGAPASIHAESKSALQLLTNSQLVVWDNIQKNPVFCYSFSESIPCVDETTFLWTRGIG